MRRWWRRAARHVRSGDRFRVTEDTPVSIGTVWRAPIHTGGARAVLAKGTTLVAMDQLPKASGIDCYPEDYDGLEPRLVPDDDRRHKDYMAYYVFVPLELIGTVLERLEPTIPRPENRLPRHG